MPRLHNLAWLALVRFGQPFSEDRQMERPNWFHDACSECGDGATAEQIAREVSARPEFIGAIQKELDRKVDSKVAGPSQSQRIARSLAEALTAR